MNGAAALQLTEPKSTPAIETRAPTEIEQEIGRLIAEAVISIYMAAEKYEAGKPTFSTTAAGAELIVRLRDLRDSAPNLDFEAVAHREGRRAMRSILERNPAAAALCQDRGLDAVLDELASMPIDILNKVLADARLWAD